MLPKERDELLEETYRLVKANNKMLKSMRRAAFISGLFRLLFWAVVLGVPVWAYFTYLQPMLGDIIQLLQTMQQTGSQLQQIGNLGAVESLNQEAAGLLQSILGQFPGLLGQ